MSRKPAIKGASFELDKWDVKDNGALYYRIAVDYDRCKRDAMSSDDLHELTRERSAYPNQWEWIDADESKPVEQDDVRSGSHLATLRNWVKWNASNGAHVIWGSEDIINLMPLSIGDLERLAQRIADAATEDQDKLKAQIETLRKRTFMAEAAVGDAEARIARTVNAEVTAAREGLINMLRPDFPDAVARLNHFIVAQAKHASEDQG